METIYQEELNGLTIRIFQDDDASRPYEDDDGAFLVHYHRDCWIENKDVLSEDDLRDIYQGNDTEAVRDLKKRFHIFPVSAYIHGGVMLSLDSGNFHPFDGQGWDTSHVGAIFLSKKEWKTKSEKALKYAKGMIETYNDYLSGNVYGYQITDKDDNDLDSCWGFYGDYDSEYGALSEAHRYIKSVTNNGTTDHNGQVLMFTEEVR